MGRTSDGVAPPPLRRGVFGMRPSVRVAVMGEGRAGRGGVCLFGDPRAISRRPSFPRRAIVAYLESRKRLPRCVAQRMGAALGSAYASSSASKFRDVHWRNLPAMAYSRESLTCGRSGAKRPRGVLPIQTCRFGEVHAARSRNGSICDAAQEAFYVQWARGIYSSVFPSHAREQ